MSKRRKVVRLGIDESPNHDKSLPIIVTAVSSSRVNDVQKTSKRTIKERRKSLGNEKEMLPYIGSDFRFVIVTPEERRGVNYFAIWDAAVYTLIRHYLERGFRVDPHIDGDFGLIDDFYLIQERRAGNLIGNVQFHKKKGCGSSIPLIQEAHCICTLLGESYKYHQSIDDELCSKEGHERLDCYRYYANKGLYLAPEDIESRIKLLGRAKG
jgi:hypothetical protein